MRILFDHNAPVPLRYSLQFCEVATAADHGWEKLTNGKLLDAAEMAGFDILLTADKGFQHQQNLAQREIAVLILSRGNWPDVRLNVQRVVEALRACKPGTCTLVDFDVSTASHSV